MNAPTLEMTQWMKQMSPFEIKVLLFVLLLQNCLDPFCKKMQIDKDGIFHLGKMSQNEYHLTPLSLVHMMLFTNKLTMVAIERVINTTQTMSPRITSDKHCHQWCYRQLWSLVTTNVSVTHGSWWGGNSTKTLVDWEYVPFSIDPCQFKPYDKHIPVHYNKHTTVL
jgi:hypothetical protein